MLPATQIPKAQHVQAVDLSEAAGNQVSIRTGTHPTGIIVTPAVDAIVCVTGQTAKNAVESWRILKDETKRELQKDIINNANGAALLKLRFPCSNDKWYAMDVISVNQGFLKLPLLLSHPNAMTFRYKAADVICKVFEDDDDVIQSIQETLAADQGVVATLDPQAQNVQVVDFSEVTGNQASIRVGTHPAGLIVTPVVDAIVCVTGQTPRHSSDSWRNLSDETKQELQKDITNTANGPALLKLRFPAPNGKWYSMDILSVNQGLLKLPLLLSHPNAAVFRGKAAEILCGAFAGDERLVQSIRANARGDSPVTGLFQAAQGAAGVPALLPPPPSETDLARIQELQVVLRCEQGVLQRRVEAVALEKDLVREREEAEKRTAEYKLDAEKQAAEYKLDAEKQAAEYKLDAEKQLALEKEESEKRVLEHKAEVEARLIARREESEKRKQALEKELVTLKHTQTLEKIRLQKPGRGRPSSANAAPASVIRHEFGFLSAVANHGVNMELSSTQFYKLYTTWAENQPLPPLKQNKLGVLVAGVPGFSRSRQASGMHYAVDRAALTKFLADQNALDANARLPN